MSNAIANLAAVSNLVFKQLHFLSVGDKEDLLALKKDSVILLAKGKVLFITKQDSKEYVAPQILYVKAFVEHTVESLTDNTVLYIVLPININPEEGFIDYKNSIKTRELLHLINGLSHKNENS